MIIHGCHGLPCAHRTCPSQCSTGNSCTHGLN